MAGEKSAAGRWDEDAKAALAEPKHPVAGDRGGGPNQYIGEPDERQEGDIAPSRFRPRYRELDPIELMLHDAIKTKAETLELMFDKVLDTNQSDPAVQADKRRYHALAMTALEQSVMWVIKALTA